MGAAPRGGRGKERARRNPGPGEAIPSGPSPGPMRRLAPFLLLVLLAGCDTAFDASGPVEVVYTFEVVRGTASDVVVTYIGSDGANVVVEDPALPFAIAIETFGVTRVGLQVEGVTGGDLEAQLGVVATSGDQVRGDVQTRQVTPSGDFSLTRQVNLY